MESEPRSRFQDDDPGHCDVVEDAPRVRIHSARPRPEAGERPGGTTGTQARPDPGADRAPGVIVRETPP